MTTTESKAAEKIADELMRIGKAAPTFRAEQLGSSAKAIRAHVESGDIAEEDARDNLIAAAVRAGLDGKDADDVVTWAWFGEHAPKVREMYPAAFPPPEPEGFEEVAARLDASDLERTGEHPTALVCAARGLACLADHLKAVDVREPGHRLSTVMWDEPMTNDSAVRSHLWAVRSGLDSTLVHFKRGDRDVTAEFLALGVVGLVAIAADLGLDLGEALGRVVPARAERSTVVEDQAAS